MCYMFETVLLIKLPYIVEFRTHNVFSFVGYLLNVYRRGKAFEINSFRPFIHQHKKGLTEMRNVVTADGVESLDASHFTVTCSVIPVYDIRGVG